MKHKILHVFALLTLYFCSQTALAQLMVDNSLTPTQLASLISGQGVRILNPQVKCATTGFGKYNAMNSNLNITEGLLLTTGTINNAIGPNNIGNKTAFFGSQFAPNTYPLLNNYTGKTTWEFCEFEFDIVPQGDTIKFDFVFASEEYEEWVGSQYNDVFAFFISGPGIVPDAGAGVFKNIALLPNSSIPVTINNVNQNINTQYYQNNNNGTSVQYDGFTRGLKAISQVQPCQTYHLKLVVADVSDKLWDSGVFIEKISSNNIILLSQTAGGIPNMVEGCNSGTVSFTRQNVTNQPLTVQYWLDGTATNGIDYPLIGSSANPLIPKSITIPANQSTATINISPFQDGINEGLEYITVYLGNPYCSNSIMDSLRFYIQDSLFTTVSPLVDTICMGESVQYNTLGGGSSFVWTPTIGLNNANISNPIATPISTTAYTLTTSASNCVYTQNSIIKVSDISIRFTSSNLTCNGLNNGIASVIPTGGNTPYIISWTGPNGFTASTATISNLAAGTYHVTVTEKNGCYKTGVVVITEPASILNTNIYSQTNVLCFGNNTGSVTVSASGGTPGYTYSWNTIPVQTTATISNLLAGTYSCTVKDLNNCSFTVPVVITQPSTALNASIVSQTNVLCKGNVSGSATILGSGGASGYLYSWNTVPVQNGPTANNLAAGTYICTVKDSNNCTINVSVTITQPANVLAASLLNKIDVLCYGGTTGSATVTSSGGTPSYTYSWNTSPIQTTATATNLRAGNYTCTVKDANNCTKIVNVVISQPNTMLGVSISNSTDVLCKGESTGSATASVTGGSGAYLYFWNSVPVQNTNTASNLSAGNYTVTVVDNNGCSLSVTETVTINEPAVSLASTIMSPMFNGNNLSCYSSSDGSIDLSVSGGNAPYLFSWVGPNNYTASTEDISLLSAGIYTVTITDANGCSLIDSKTLSEPVELQINISVTPATCPSNNDGAIDLTLLGGTSPISYLWNGPNTFSANTEDVNGLVAGNYVVIVTDVNGCSKSTNITVTQPGTMTLSYSVSTYVGGNNIACFGGANGSIGITVAGGNPFPGPYYNYLWSGPGSFTSTDEGINLLNAGTYEVIVTDANGCNISETIVLTEPDSLQATLSPSIFKDGYNISCYGTFSGSINTLIIGGTGGYNYSWVGPNGFSSNTKNIQQLEAGTYTLTVRDTNSCSVIKTITLTEPVVLTAVISSTIYPGGFNLSCNGASNGNVSIGVSGGVAAYYFVWSGPNGFTSNAQNISSLNAGIYEVEITDANNCKINLTQTLSEPSPIVGTVIPSQYIGGNNISCSNAADGTLTLFNAGGVAPYTQLWSGPNGFVSSSISLSGLTSGIYYVTITDANNCVKTDSIILKEPNPITTFLSSPNYAGGNNLKCNNDNSGVINCTISGGNHNYLFTWVGPNGFASSSQNLFNVEAGSYSVKVTDSNGCLDSSTIVLIEPHVLSSNIISTIATCTTPNGAADLTVTGGTMPFTYLWSNLATTQDLNGVAGGIYFVQITDANNCVIGDSVRIDQTSFMTLDAVIKDGKCYNGADGSIDLTVYNSQTPVTYSWSTGENTEDLISLMAGNYVVTVTDGNGCVVTETYVVNQSTPILISHITSIYLGEVNISSFQGYDGSIDLNVIGGHSPYTYSWSNGAVTQDVFGLPAGTYNVLVTDSLGCIQYSIITLKEPLALQMPTGISPNGDGKNDYFVVHGLELFPKNRLTIFNRWGNVVFEKSDYQNNWSGTGVAGDQLPVGTYFVILELDNNQKVLKNYIDIRR